MQKLNPEHREEAAILGLAELFHEVTDYPEDRCKRMALGLIAMSSKDYDTSEEF